MKNTGKTTTCTSYWTTSVQISKCLEVQWIKLSIIISLTDNLTNHAPYVELFSFYFLIFQFTNIKELFPSLFIWLNIFFIRYLCFFPLFPACLNNVNYKLDNLNSCQASILAAILMAAFFSLALFLWYVIHDAVNIFGQLIHLSKCWVTAVWSVVWSANVVWVVLVTVMSTFLCTTYSYTRNCKSGLLISTRNNQKSIIESTMLTQ